MFWDVTNDEWHQWEHDKHGVPMVGDRCITGYLPSMTFNVPDQAETPGVYSGSSVYMNFIFMWMNTVHLKGLHYCVLCTNWTDQLRGSRHHCRIDRCLHSHTWCTFGRQPWHTHGHNWWQRQWQGNTLHHTTNTLPWTRERTSCFYELPCQRT